MDTPSKCTCWGGYRTDEPVMRRLVALALKWIQEGETSTFQFIPNNEEQDRIAKTRTGACGRQLLSVLAGQRQ